MEIAVDAPVPPPRPAARAPAARTPEPGRTVPSESREMVQNALLGQRLQPAVGGNPDYVERPFHVVLVTIYSVENAGIRYVSAALKRAGFETTIVFLRDWRHNQLDMPSDREFRMVLDIIRQKGADMVGVGFMSSLLPMARELSRRVKQSFPDTPLVWGGIHPTSVPDECIGEVDFLCVGEGELAAIDLATALRDCVNGWLKSPAPISCKPCSPK